MRFISSVARVAMVLLLATACGESDKPSEPSECGPMTCDGCCNAGTCQPGNTVLACGEAGGACSACGAGQVCDDGACAAPLPTDGGSGDGGIPDAGPQETFILFDPRGPEPVLPEPNTLQMNSETGLVNLPVRATDSAAQQEFTRDHVNTLNGFLETVTATARASAPLDITTVNAQTVRVIQVFGPAGPGEPIVAYNEDTQRINVLAPLGWARGGWYMVAVVGGESGVRDMQNRPVVGSQALQWLRSTRPLVDDSGRSTVPGLPDADAPSLEQLRRGYAGYFDELEDRGVRREDVAALWTFRIHDRPQVTFSPSTRVTPFPSNLYLSPVGPRVMLPPPAQQTGLLADTIAGLNRLNGFSTTAAIVSENSPTLGPLDDGRVDPATFSEGTGFFPLGGTGAQPRVRVCLSCTSSQPPDGSPPTSREELQFVPEVPLEENTTYAAVITTSLKDIRGRRATASTEWALVRLKAPLIDSEGRSQVRVLPDVIAQGLEPMRRSLAPTLDALAAQGIPRAQVALANVFTTQSTLSELGQLMSLARTAPAAPSLVVDESSQLPSLGVPLDQVGGLYEARFSVANLLTGPGGVIGGSSPRLEQARMLLTVPNTAMPVAGWPVVLFAHDVTQSREAVLHVANELARAGFAAAAMDAVLHGERSTCAGSGVPRGVSDDEACADPGAQRCDLSPTSASFGRCVSLEAANRPSCSGAQGDLFCAQRGLGRCVPAAEGSVCEGGTFRIASGTWRQPAISGWNMLDFTKPFALRDTLRQAAVDLGQLVRVLRSPELATALGTVKLDTARPHFLGLGVGSMAGSLFLGVDTDVQRAVLNTPGASLLDLLLTSPQLAPQRAAWLSRLQAEGLSQGTPAHDAFLRYQRQAFDAGDPLNAAWALKHRPGVPAGRDVFVQYIQGDTVLPNRLTEALLAAGNAPGQDNWQVYRWELNFLPEQFRHGFLLLRVEGAPPFAEAAQQQAATFLQTGTAPIP
jgi:hypothetical protein